MNNFEIVILAIALVFNSWLTYLNAGVYLSAESLKRKSIYFTVMFLSQFLMAGAGIWIGFKAGSTEMQTNMAISLSIMFIMGLSAILSAIRTPAEEKPISFNDLKFIILLSLTEGITPFLVGLAIGLLSLAPYLHWLLLGLFLLAGITSAFLIAKRMGLAAFKLKPGALSGLLLLAAAIKLSLNLTGF